MPGTLGISPGTRSIGVAVLCDGKLTFSKLHSFNGAWSKGKLHTILCCLEEYIQKNHIKAIAVKIPDVLPVSRPYMELIGSMNVLFELHNIKAMYYPLSDLKRRYCTDGAKTNNAALCECIARRFPDLFVEYRKGRGNKNLYYHKLFEAVAAGNLLHRI